MANVWRNSPNRMFFWFFYFFYFDKISEEPESGLVAYAMHACVCRVDTGKRLIALPACRGHCDTPNSRQRHACINNWRMEERDVFGFYCCPVPWPLPVISPETNIYSALMIRTVSTLQYCSIKMHMSEQEINWHRLVCGGNNESGDTEHLESCVPHNNQYWNLFKS